jgi:hypothetical protein
LNLHFADAHPDEEPAGDSLSNVEGCCGSVVPNGEGSSGEVEQGVLCNSEPFIHRSQQRRTPTTNKLSHV